MFGRKRRWEQESITVGVAGVSRGTGTTFSTMMMAYFQKQVRKETVAVAERNYSGHLRDYAKGGTVKGIDVMTREDDVKEKGRYTYLFFDYGTQIQPRAGEMPEFSKCMLQFVTAGAADWKQRELFDFVERNKKIPGNEAWVYLMPFASLAVRKDMERKLQRTVYRVAAEKEWYHMGAENLALWEAVFAEETRRKTIFCRA